MKRFLSLVLSALFVFQFGNASCDAGSNWDARKVPVQQRGLFVPYIPQQQPIINVTAPEPTPQNITIQQPEMKPNFNVKVDATTFADKLWSWLKIALAAAAICVTANICWPVIKFFTGISNPLDTVKGWGEGAVKWVKGIWNEDGEETSADSDIEKLGADRSSSGGTINNILTTILVLVGLKNASSAGTL